jgi:hypothetical protein
MYESTGTITGVARLQGQTMHSDIVVTVEGLPGYVTATDAEGNYTLLSVPARRKSFRLVFTKPDYVPASLTGVVVDKDRVTPLTSINLIPLHPN